MENKKKTIKEIKNYLEDSLKEGEALQSINLERGYSYKKDEALVERVKVFIDIVNIRKEKNNE